jgi:hypothetical protein
MISTSLSNFDPVIVWHYIGYAAFRIGGNIGGRLGCWPNGADAPLLISGKGEIDTSWKPRSVMLCQIDRLPGIQISVTARQIGISGLTNSAVSRLSKKMKFRQHEIVFFEITAGDNVVVTKTGAPFTLDVFLPEVQFESVHLQRKSNFGCGCFCHAVSPPWFN